MTISNWLKYVFLIHFILTLVFGILWFLIVEDIATMTGWPWTDPVSGRVLGAMFFGWAIGSFFGYRATEWSEVKIIVIADMVWCLFATVAFVWMLAVHATLPIMVTGLYLSLVVIFFILFLYAYYTHN